MRVGINGNFWSKPQTGSGQYVRELLAAMSRCAPENSYRAILPKVVPASHMAGELAYARPALTGLGEGVAKTWFEQVTFPRVCKRERVDLAHVPYFASPIVSTVKTIVTIHDLIPILLPLYRGSTRVQMYTRLVSESAKRAQAVIADSECSKRDIVERLGIPPERITVVYLAADERFRPVEDTAAVRAKYKLPERFVLYLGGYDQRKNVRVLIHAFARLPERQRVRVRLVLAGMVPDVDTAFLPNPRRMVRESGLPENVVQFTGEIAEEDKPALYSSAEAFAFPSLYEGFGLPVLEAMACGTPTACSNTSSLPEVAGSAGFLLDPLQVDAWAEALRALVSDSARRGEMRARGLEQVRRFSWERTARATLQIYKQVLAA